MTEPSKKKQLHNSHLTELQRCGYKFQLKHVEGRREPSTPSLIIGKATHSTNAKNLTLKMNGDSLLVKEAIQEFSRDEFLKEWNSAPLVLGEADKALGLNKVRDLSQDHAIALSVVHSQVLAPVIQPIGVERKGVIEADGYPYDLALTIDIEEKNAIRDTKTKAKNTGAKEVITSDQYTLYAMFKFLVDGSIPEFVYQDNLIRPMKTKGAQAITYRATRTKEDFDIFNYRFEQACQIIEKEIFTPANPSGFDSPCGWCGFGAAGECKYYNTKRISVSLAQVKEETDAKRSESRTLDQGDRQPTASVASLPPSTYWPEKL